MNVVVDTSVLISAIFWTGSPADVLRIILKKYTLVQSQATIIELERVISREKFKKLLQKRIVTPEAIIETLITQSKFYDISERSKAKARKIRIADVDDRIFFELALEAHAKFIVSGDKHILDLKETGKIKILSVNEFLALHSEPSASPDKV